MNYIGIDFHKKYSVACVQDEDGKVIKRARIEGNSAEGFRRCLNTEGEPARAVIEACWNWGKVYDTLEGIEGIQEIVLAHPLKTRLIADAPNQDGQDRCAGACDAVARQLGGTGACALQSHADAQG